MTVIGFQVQVNSEYMTSDISVQTLISIWAIVKSPEIWSLLGFFNQFSYCVVDITG